MQQVLALSQRWKVQTGLGSSLKYILSREDTEWMSCNKNKVVYNRVKMKHSQQQDCLPSWIENLPDFKAGQNLKTLKRERKKINHQTVDNFYAIPKYFIICQKHSEQRWCGQAFVKMGFIDLNTISRLFIQRRHVRSQPVCVCIVPVELACPHRGQVRDPRRMRPVTAECSMICLNKSK